MTSPNDELSPNDESPERAELREKLANLLRKTGKLAPSTDEEIEAFEKREGPPPPLDPAFVERMNERILRRIQGETKKPRPSRLWQDPTAAPRELVAVHSNRDDQPDPDAEAKLEKHREELREEPGVDENASDKPEANDEKKPQP